MSKACRVFLGAPAVRDLSKDPAHYHWRTVTSSKPSHYGLPPATLEAASRRISLLYQNIIFGDTGDESQDEESDADGQLDNGEQTTAITWPPTAEGPTESDIISRIGVSFLRPTPSMSRGQPQLETQETQETASYNYSEASSIARFPEFHFSLHTLTRLSSMIAHLQAQAKRHVRKGSQKITILAAVLEVEGPDTICIKKGADAGKEVSILKVILGDEEGVVCKLTAWRETAETWGGAEVSAPGIKRGDVVLFENVLASWGTEPGSDWNAVPLTLTASPNLKSSLQICFRTMPYVSDDQRFRPDLRLGSSDAAFGKVALVVKWFEDMAGLPTG